MGWLRKTVASAGRAGAEAAPPFSAEAGVGEATWEFLTRRVWEEDGSPREPGTVLFFQDAGGLKVLLNDKDGSRVAFVTLRPEEGLWQAVEDAILSTATDWRDAKRPPSGKRG